MSATRDAARALLEYALMEEYSATKGIQPDEWASQVPPMVKHYVETERHLSVIQEVVAENEWMVSKVEHLFAEFASGVNDLLGGPGFDTESLNVRYHRLSRESYQAKLEFARECRARGRFIGCEEIIPANDHELYGSTEDAAEWEKLQQERRTAAQVERRVAGQ